MPSFLVSLPPTLTENLLLAALSEASRQLFQNAGETIELPFGEVLAHPGDRIRQVYFPTNGFISLVMPINATDGLEVGLIGNEGMWGTPLLLGINSTPFHAAVQGAGSALRISAAKFLALLEQHPELLSMLKRYLYVCMQQLAQSAGCNRYHMVEARLARLLLMTQDRAHAATFHITQESMAQMLGVRRVGVTKAARALQMKNLISYSRGEVRIDDSQGLQAASCQCYQADKETYRQILG